MEHLLFSLDALCKQHTGPDRGLDSWNGPKGRAMSIHDKVTWCFSGNTFDCFVERVATNEHGWRPTVCGNRFRFAKKWWADEVDRALKARGSDVRCHRCHMD